MRDLAVSGRGGALMGRVLFVDVGGCSKMEEAREETEMGGGGA